MQAEEKPVPYRTDYARLEALSTLTELGKKIDVLFVRQFARIAFHQNDDENDYRVEEKRLSRLMLDKSIPDEKHLEYARAITKRAEAYQNDFIVPLQKLNADIERHLVTLEQTLRTEPPHPGDLATGGMERWLLLSKELNQARAMATDSIVNQIESDKRIPAVVIRDNGRADITLSEEESKQFQEGLEACAALMKASYEADQRIQQEREPLARQLFPTKNEVAAVGPPPAPQPATAVHPFEGKAWFRLMKVLYVGSWILGLAVSAVLAYGAEQFWVFMVGVVILGIVLVVLKKVFYYVVLGRTTANEKPGKGFVDLEDLRNDLAEVQASSFDVYEEAVAPFFESSKAQYGRRIPLHAVRRLEATLRGLQERVANEVISIKEKKQQIINNAARQGATIAVCNIRQKLEQSMAEYKGTNRQEYIRQVERLLTSLEVKYGATIPVDEASKLLDRLEQDIDASERAHGGA